MHPGYDTPPIKSNLSNREGLTLIYKAHRQDVYTMFFEEQLKNVNLYSIQRRGDRYQII